MTLSLSAVPSLQIGAVSVPGAVVLAPMAGITDAPLRRMALRYGASLAVSEMVASEALETGHEETVLRAEGAGVDLHAVQLAGNRPESMARAARLAEAAGAALIDINMGCPAKKVCNVMAGSALLKDEPLVGRILAAVVRAVPEVPVTLKTRTGWDKSVRNALTVLRIAQESGIQALALHGRTRACGYTGEAEYDTIKAVKAEAGIPVIANGDITSPEKAKYVLDYTGADAIMIGRAAMGRPWLFREIGHYLTTGEHLPAPEVVEIHQIMLEHLDDLYRFYGEITGVRMARKHIAWYTRGLADSASFRHAMNQLETSGEQLAAANEFFSRAAEKSRRLVYLQDTALERRAA